MGRTPVSSSASRAPLEVVAALMAVVQHPGAPKPKRRPPQRATRWRDRSPAPRMTSAAWVRMARGKPQVRTFRESCR
jgi:hypothetical protein